MSIKINTPYHNTPYDALSDPDLGPFPINGSCADAEKRWAELMVKGVRPDAAKATAFSTLRSPGERMKWDIFCAPLEKEPQGHQGIRQALSTILANIEASFGSSS